MVSMHVLCSVLYGRVKCCSSVLIHTAISPQFSDDEMRFIETPSYLLELSIYSSVTWKTLSDVLGHFKTNHSIDELLSKIVYVYIQTVTSSPGMHAWCYVLSAVVVCVMSGVVKCCSIVMCACVCAASSSHDGELILQLSSSCEWRSSCYKRGIHSSVKMCCVHL